MSDHNDDNRREMGRRASDDVLYLLAPHILNDEQVQGKILEQLERIEKTQIEMAEKSAVRAVEIAKKEFYTGVGKTIVSKFFWLVGVVVVGLFAWLNHIGVIKL